MRLIRDSRRQPSWSLTIAIPMLIILTLRYLIGGLTLSLPNVGIMTFVLTPMTGGDYALVISPWLAFLGWRNQIAANAPQQPPLG